MSRRRLLRLRIKTGIELIQSNFGSTSAESFCTSQYKEIGARHGVEAEHTKSDNLYQHTVLQSRPTTPRNATLDDSSRKPISVYFLDSTIPHARDHPPQSTKGRPIDRANAVSPYCERNAA